MWSNILDRISLTSLFLVVVLLPVFFLPFTGIPVETSKGLLLVVGLAISLIFWTVARFSDGKVSFPRSPVILAGLAIVLTVLLSALFSGASQTSFFGIIFDVGSFWFIFASFLLMFIASVMIKDGRNGQMLLFGIIFSSVLVLIFQIFRFFMPEALSFSVLGSSTDNLVGSLNTFGLLAGFTCLSSLFVLEFFPITKLAKFIFGLFVLISLFAIASVNYLLIWELLGVFALFIFVYKISFFSHTRGEGTKAHFPIFSLGIVMVALLFFMSGQFIGGYLPARLSLSNTEVSPSLGGTLMVAKESLKHDPVFGVGPNRFSEAWSMYKPMSINSTPFWDVSFNFGSGLLPTFIATTGILGILAWLAFLGFFLISGARSLFVSIKSSINREMAIFFLLALYLFIATFFYSAGLVILLLAFAFTGAFLGLLSRGEDDQVEISFLDDHRKSFFFILSLVVIMVMTAALAFKYIERFASITHFRKSIQAATVEDAQVAIGKALSLHRNDLYMRTYAQVYLVKLNTLLGKNPSELSEAQKAELQASFDQALLGASGAIAYNPKNYLNHQALGNLYSVAGALGVKDAYAKAGEAYKAASMLNPLNPGIKLAMARAAIADGKTKEAKELALLSLSLKPDYIDALILLSQLSKEAGESRQALIYAEQALALAPESKELLDYVNSLKGGE